MNLDSGHRKKLKELQDLRNKAEHKYSELPHPQVRELISSSFSLLLKLLELCDESPRDALGSAYDTMLELTDIYERELLKCRSSFKAVLFPFKELDQDSMSCMSCRSLLILQYDPTNTDHTALAVAAKVVVK